MNKNMCEFCKHLIFIEQSDFNYYSCWIYGPKNVYFDNISDRLKFDSFYPQNRNKNHDCKEYEKAKIYIDSEGLVIKEI